MGRVVALRRASVLLMFGALLASTSYTLAQDASPSPEAVSESPGHSQDDRDGTPGPEPDGQTAAPTGRPTEDPVEDDRGHGGRSAPPEPPPSASPKVEGDSSPKPSVVVTPTPSPAQSPGPTGGPSVEQTPRPSAQPRPPVHASSQAFGGWFQYDMDQETMEGRLYVGTLDGPTHKVLSTDGVGIHASGPVNGLVIADWREDGRFAIAVFDTRTGKRDTLRVSEKAVGGAALSADGSGYYWYEGKSGGPFELWFERLDGTGGKRLADTIRSTAPVLRQSLDGAWLVSYDWWLDDDAYTVVDVERGGSWELTPPVANEVLGILDDSLITYGTTGEERAFPLVAVDLRSADVRGVVEGNGSFASVFGPPDDPQLVWDAHDGDDMLLLAAGPGDADPHTIYRATIRGVAHAPRMVPVGSVSGVEAGGLVPLFPDAQVYLPDDRDSIRDGILVDPVTGDRYPVRDGALPEVQR